jgi:hypothetical protein
LLEEARKDIAVAAPGGADAKLEFPERKARAPRRIVLARRLDAADQMNASSDRRPQLRDPK